MSQDTGRPLPKFGEWDVNDPASAEGFTVIFNKARDEKKTGGKPESPGKGDDSHVKSGVNPAKPHPFSTVKDLLMLSITKQDPVKDLLMLSITKQDPVEYATK
ncbi:hypothetical protein DKX38_025551 [Salix brachista]|uniref:RIN4 pathogenic type III effector avirulence factor Avr cleavage site domain-containing protein n=1 Tax=Salix brachista TaxID=2182728 RepID=A0A5N5JQ16_9ROSI|nr:hypothetical protein DKX38_025551 [Salix brachista]